mmetsp:Transcript_6512/g.23377  ORF Transcript_6512/g.23377 Transcript_6512/m.23377 type:complete len:280 (-) Transcript_6512:223-1062(-)
MLQHLLRVLHVHRRHHLFRLNVRHVLQQLREGAVLTVRDEMYRAQPSPGPGGEFCLAVVGPTGGDKGDDLLDAMPRPQLLHIRPVGLKIRPRFSAGAPLCEAQVRRAWILRQSTGELVDAAKAQMSHLVGRGIQFLARRPVDRQEDPLLSYVVTREDVEGPAPAGVPLPVFDRLDNVIDRRRLVWELVLWITVRGVQEQDPCLLLPETPKCLVLHHGLVPPHVPAVDVSPSLAALDDLEQELHRARAVVRADCSHSYSFDGDGILVVGVDMSQQLALDS